MRHRLQLLLLTALVSIFGLQAQSSFVGDWQGTLRLPVGSLRLVLHLQQDSSQRWSATLDSPDQQAFGLPVSQVVIHGDSLHLSATTLGLSYAARQATPGLLKGLFRQGSLSLPLELRQGNSSPSTPAPYQTPKELEGFTNHELSIPVTGTDVTLAGTLTLPRGGKAPYPTLILITGSGPQDRDETLLGKHKPFLYLTQALCEAGYAVFRYDDRGTGRSTGNFANSHIADFVRDAFAVLDQVRQRPEVQPGKLFLLGHSEGAYVASKVATQHPELAGVISLAGAASSVEETLLTQLQDLARSVGTSPETQKKLRSFNQEVYALLKDPKLSLDSVKERVSSLYQARTDLPKFGLSREQLLSQLTPYLRELLQLDIEGTWRSVHVPVIGLYGGKDMQVSPKQAAALQRLLPQAAVATIPGINHLFLPAPTGSPLEYASLSPGFSPEALQYLLAQLNRLR